MPTASTRTKNRLKLTAIRLDWLATGERRTLLKTFGIGGGEAATYEKVFEVAHSLNCLPINKSGVFRMDNSNDNEKPKPQPSERRSKTPTAEQALEMLESACGFVWANGFKIETTNDDSGNALVIRIIGARRDVDAINKTRFTARAKPEPQPA